ncbi:hypothetical protein F5X96DRAFT_650411 [Biscogniauxia mediterranea]|nr:hypothetical protein F5X96DRAFT_650411 [Biscogniauxia mediterranea]
MGQWGDEWRFSLILANFFSFPLLFKLAYSLSGKKASDSCTPRYQGTARWFSAKYEYMDVIDRHTHVVSAHLR